MAGERDQRRDQPPRPGPIGRLVGGMVGIVSFVALGLVFSLLFEWAGMTWWWPDQGMQHSIATYKSEVGYLGEDFQHSILTDFSGSTPGQFAASAGTWAYEHLVAPWGGEDLAKELLRRPKEGKYPTAGEYLGAGVVVVQAYAVRLAIVMLALPAFLLVFVAAAIDGLVRRDLRKWGGGRESSWVYGHAKRLIGVGVFLPGVIYLAIPVPIHPTLVFLPFLAVTAVTVATTLSTFKKYA